MGLKDSQDPQLCQIANQVWVGALNWILYVFFREITVCAHRTKLTSFRCSTRPLIFETFLNLLTFIQKYFKERKIGPPYKFGIFLPCLSLSFIFCCLHLQSFITLFGTSSKRKKILEGTNNSERLLSAGLQVKIRKQGNTFVLPVLSAFSHSSINKRGS